MWDHAAGSIVLEEAGGSVTDLDGKKLDFMQGTKLLKNRGILAIVPEESQKVVDLLRNLMSIVCCYDPSVSRLSQFKVRLSPARTVPRQIVLASQSPRRLQILKQIGLQFTVNVSRFEENLDKTKMTPVAVCAFHDRRRSM